MKIATPTSARRHADPLEILVEASEIVASHSLALDELLAALAELVRKVVDYQLLAVFLKTGENTLHIRFSIGYREELVRHLRLKLGEGITGVAAQDRRTVVVNDVSQDSRYLMAVDVVRSEMAVPFIARNKLVGVISVQSAYLDAFGDYEKYMVELIASRFSLAIDAARLHRATVRQNQTLRTLAEIAQDFAHLLNLEELLGEICRSVRRVIPYDAFSILLVEEDRQVLKHYFGVRFDERTQWESIPVGKGIVGTAAARRRPVLVRDTDRDPRYLAALEGIRSEVAVPLMAKDEVIGVIDLESERVGAFTKRDVRILTLLAPQIAIAIENARLYEQVTRNQERLERDLEAARQLQQQLLPSGRPSFEGLEVAARNDPASEVTGDLYDFFVFPTGELGVMIGDVSGKGAAAALYAAMASGLLRNVVQPGDSPALLLEAANKALGQRPAGSRYLTAAFVKWSADRYRMWIANAGQPRPILRRGEKIEPLSVSGIPLGLLENSEYEELELDLRQGDLLLMVSDGITETGDPDQPQYGEQRLVELLRQNAQASPAQLLESIFEDVQSFAMGKRQLDDRTVIVAKVTG